MHFEIGSFLDEKVDPKNEQQRALKETWDVGNEDERKTIARLMVKLVQQIVKASRYRGASRKGGFSAIFHSVLQDFDEYCRIMFLILLYIYYIILKRGGPYGIQTMVHGI